MKVTHETIAANAGVSRTFVTQILQKKRRASDIVAKRLEKASGWSWLFWAHPKEFDRDGTPLLEEPPKVQP